MNIGDRIREIRKQKGFTQAELGKRLEPPVPWTDISSIERGERTPGAEKLRRLAKALGVTVGEIMGEKPPQPLPPDPEEEEIKALLRGIPSESDKKKILEIIRAFRKAVDAEEAASGEEGSRKGK